MAMCTVRATRTRSLWSPNRAVHYILQLWFLLIIISSFFLRLFSAVGDWLFTILSHMMWPIENLECRSEMWCIWLVENTRRKKSPPTHHRTTFSGYIFASTFGITS